MIITGLDLSLCATGIATWTGEWDIQTVVPIKGATGMRRLDWLARDILARLADADLIVCEDIAFSRNMAGHSEVVMLHGFIRRELWIDDRPLVLVASTSLKKFATGRGNAEKDQISKEVLRRWGIDTADNNQADAVVLAQIGRALIGELDGLTKPMQEVLAVVNSNSGNPTLTSPRMLYQVTARCPRMAALTEEQRRELASRAGKASANARKKRDDAE